MYYQFCLLCIFRPFACVAFDDFEINPQSICLEAAQSIIGLATMYTRVNTLGIWPLLVPYFVRSAGTLCASIGQIK
jgi:hypothetical protein